MEHLSAIDLSGAGTWMVITTLLYFLMNGAQIFETVVLIPKWTAAPPQSLQMFRSPHGIDLKTFWIVMHSIHEITFITALVFCWNLEVRNTLMVLFALHFAVRIWTIFYFAPKVMAFQKIANENTTGPEILAQARLWRKLNYLRVALFIAVSLGLIPVCLEVL